MDHFIKIIDSLAWPITILFLVFIFRAELRKIMARLSQLKYKEFEASFNQYLRSAEEQAQLLESSDQKNLLSQTEATEKDLSIENFGKTLKSLKSTLNRIAEISPRAAIAEAWVNIELHSKKAAEDMGLDSTDPSVTLNVLKKFIPLIYKESIIDLYNSLRVMRNQGIHSPEFALSSEEAERYINLTIELIHMIRAGTLLGSSRERR